MVNDYYGETHKNYGMLFIMICDLGATFFILLLTYFRYRAFARQKKKNEKEEVFVADEEMKEVKQ